MDILVTFPDGTTELRAANSPCAISDSPLAWTPINVTDIDPLSVELDDKTDPGLWVVTDRGGPLYLSRGRCGARTYQLRAWRGFESVDVWRITGQDAVTKALTGEWQSCRVETVDEQIARLTRERDLLDFACDGYEQELTHLRRAARQAIAAINGRDPGDVKASTLAAFLRDIAGRP